MIAVKTETGQRAFKDRSVALSPRQRSAFILFDGQRTVREVLSATGTMGVTMEDVAYLIDCGMLAETPASEASKHSAVSVAMPGASEVPAANDDTAADVVVEDAAARHQRRYQVAYPIATRLTAGLGLRGFRLNLAIEGATSYEALKALAPKIREAVGPEQFRELERALQS